MNNITERTGKKTPVKKISCIRQICEKMFDGIDIRELKQ
jgi:hypothetical protein